MGDLSADRMVVWFVWPLDILTDTGIGPDRPDLSVVIELSEAIEA